MKIRTLLFLIVTHGAVGFAGFALGIYLLPILTAPPAPTAAEVQAKSAQATYTGEFRRDLKESDALHWGEGTVSISPSSVTLMGEIAPGPDYKLYFSPQFIETEAEFERLKSTMTRVGDVKTFKNFIVELPSGFDPSTFNTVIVWCESFGEFITAAKYQ